MQRPDGFFFLLLVVLLFEHFGSVVMNGFSIREGGFI